MNHPGEKDLALLAGGEAGRMQRFLLERHVRNCAACQDKVAEYRDLRSELADFDELPDVNWNFLAADMRANIRLGLEAGACVRESRVSRRWNPRFAVAFASLLVVLLAGGEFVHNGNFSHFPKQDPAADSAPVLESTGNGVEIRTGDDSLMLLNHHANAANQTVSANGDIGEGYVDGETGMVTINNVYLQ